MKPNREIPGNTHLSNSGMVVSVRGSVVDIVFEERLPPIHSLLHTGTENQIAIEVFSQLDAHRVRGIALTPTQGLARGMVVIDTGGLLKTPVGKGILSRMFDVFGNTIDRQAAPSDVQWRTVHRAPPPLARRSTKSELFETGIKVIVRGFKEEGTTSTPFDMVVMNDLDRFHLVADVIDRVPGLTNRAAHVKQAIRDKLLEHRQYIGEHGEDLPEIRNWKC